MCLSVCVVSNVVAECGGQYNYDCKLVNIINIRTAGLPHVFTPYYAITPFNCILPGSWSTYKIIFVSFAVLFYQLTKIAVI